MQEGAFPGASWAVQAAIQGPLAARGAGYFNQPRLRKYSMGPTALKIISSTT